MSNPNLKWERKGEWNLGVDFAALNNRLNVTVDLYETLDNEEDGFTIIQECEENEDIQLILDCIIDSIAIITKEAYDNIGQKYYPEPIELVTQETFIHLLNSLQKCYGEESISKIINS